MKYVLILASFLLPAFGVRAATPPAFYFECPPTVVDGADVEQRLSVRPRGVWRVDDGILFTQGKGIFWRWVCAYGEAPEGGVEVAAHWVEKLDEDGPILEGVCGEEGREATSDSAGGVDSAGGGSSDSGPGDGSEAEVSEAGAGDTENILFSATHRAHVEITSGDGVSVTLLARNLLRAAEAAALPCAAAESEDAE